MDITVYVSGTGELAITPDCYLPSMELERTHGPLTPCGHVHVDDLSGVRGWTRISNDMDRDTYALVTLEEGKALLGARHACFRQARKLLREAGHQA